MSKKEREEIRKEKENNNRKKKKSIQWTMTAYRLFSFAHFFCFFTLFFLPSTGMNNPRAEFSILNAATAAA